MSTATMWLKWLVILIAGLGMMTALHAETRKSATFASTGGSWILKTRNGEAQSIEKRVHQRWFGSLGQVSEGVELKSKFVRTYVVAGEADEQSQVLSVIFDRQQCRDRHGKLYPFSATLHFENGKVERGCGKRLP